MHIYTVRIAYLNISDMLTFTKSTKDTEKKLCENDAKTCKKINKKWKIVLINQLKLTNLYLGVVGVFFPWRGTLALSFLLFLLLFSCVF